MKRVYFTGIGGSGMFPLARMAVAAGYFVAGQDDNLDAKKREILTDLGVTLFDTPFPEQLDGMEIFVYSSAIPGTHPVRSHAAELALRGELRLLHRMEFLNLLVERCSVRIGVAGTHGKTSTSSMMGYLLMELGLEPDIIVGGRPLYLPDGIHRGAGNLAVFETDESDGSFLNTNAPYRICLNVDADHLDYHGSLERLRDAFREFIGGARLCVLNANDPFLLSLRADPVIGKNSVYYYTDDSEVREPFSDHGLVYTGRFIGDSDEMEIKRITPEGSVELGRLRLILPGRHFASNALGVFAMIDSLVLNGFIPIPDYDPARIAGTLNRFPGIERRIERIGTYGGAEVYDDYGHHPTEIRAVLRALRGRLRGAGRLIAVFQPHRYTRTRDLHAEFGSSFADADRVFFLPLYSAGEEPIQGISSSLIASADPERFTEIAVERIADAFQGLRGDDILVSIGAGDITSIVRGFLKGGS